MDEVIKKFKRFFLFLSDSRLLLLSHHPNCSRFEGHVYHLGKYKLCIGCFTFYPTILITIMLTILLVDLSLINLFYLFYIAHAFFIPIILNIVGLTRYKTLKILSKVSIGIGVGFYIVSVLFMPFFFIIKILLLLQINFFTGVIAYIRMKHILRDCNECEYEGNWDICPAMKPIMDKLYEYGFKKQKKELLESQDLYNTEK